MRYRRPILVRPSPFLLLQTLEGGRLEGSLPGERLLVSRMRSQPAIYRAFSSAPGGQHVGYLQEAFFESATVKVTASQMVEMLEWRDYRSINPNSRQGADLLLTGLVSLGLFRTIDQMDAWEVRANRGLKKITVKTWGGLGDSLQMTPLLPALKECAGQARIEVLAVNSDDASLFEGIDCVESVRVRSFPDESPPCAPNELLIHLQAGVIGPGLDDQVVRSLGRVIGVPIRKIRPIVTLSREEVEAGRVPLSRLENGPIIAVHPCSRDPQRNWPVGHWEELIASLPGLTFVQLGAAKDQFLNGALDCRGLPLKTSLSVLSLSDCFIGVDSALQHAAAGLAIPSVVLFGPSSETLAGHPGSLIVRPPWCECYRRTWVWRQCTRNCMQDLPVQRVRKEVRLALRSGTARAHSPF